MMRRALVTTLATALLLVACAAPPRKVHGPLAALVQPGATFRDCADCPEMVVIPAGRFVMGSPAAEAGRFRQEGPQREVVIERPFAIGRTEITRAQWARFADETGHRTEPGCHVWNGRLTAPAAAADWRAPGFAQADDHPAVCISWHDARAYVAWLGRRTGRAYRLPSEAQWEYAARAGSPASRHWGDSPADACAFANVADLSGERAQPGWVAHPCDDGHVFTAPVGRLRPNAFGLHDTAGNVWEWTDDCWSESLEPSPAPAPSGCGQRVLRGGSWFSMPDFVRSAARHRLDAGLRFSEVGLRVLRDE